MKGFGFSEFLKIRISAKSENIDIKIIYIYYVVYTNFFLQLIRENQ